MRARSHKSCSDSTTQLRVYVSSYDPKNETATVTGNYIHWSRIFIIVAAQPMKMIYVSGAHRATDTAETDSASSLYHDYVSLYFQHCSASSESYHRPHGPAQTRRFDLSSRPPGIPATVKLLGPCRPPDVVQFGRHGAVLSGEPQLPFRGRAGYSLVRGCRESKSWFLLCSFQHAHFPTRSLRS